MPSPSVPPLSPVRPTDAQPSPLGRRVWLLLDDSVQAAELDEALMAEGWQVEARVIGVQGLLARLQEGAAPPDLLVSGLRFDDGDAFALMRQLGARPDPPVLYFTSRQQRAVFKGAVAMAATCGLQVAGFAEKPVAAAQIAAGLRGLQRLAVPPPRVPEPELSAAEARALLAARRLQAWVQPQMRLASREVTGFEALMHGLGEDGAILPPLRLVPALARHGLLEEASLAVMQQMAAFVAGSLGEGLPVSGAVNVALQSLSDPAFCRELSQIVARSGLDPSWITIEITETDAMADLSQVIENTSRIRLLGFNLAIDDFGTGYSSLYQLSQIPFSELKIERAFIAGLESSRTKQRIVAACAGLAAALGLRIVAEGVETPAELQAVEAAGCTEMQGYLLARPMPADAARGWLRSLPDLKVPFGSRPPRGR